MRHQQTFDFNDKQNPSRPVDLDAEQHRLLIELMGEMVFHIYHALRKESHEHSQESTED